MSDELRKQLRQLDPMHPGVPVRSLSQERLEDIMANDQVKITRRTRWYAAAAVAAALGLAVAIPALNGDTPTTVAAPPLELSLGEGSALASCMVFDVGILAGMPMAFEGTVTAVEGGQITMKVDRWFKGGDATTVELSAPTGLEGLIAGIDFVAGGQYLITAAEGTVNYCGYSGPSSPELLAAFQAAFGS